MILVTGGAGFIGSNFVRYWTGRHPQDRVVNLDALTYAGNPENLAGIDTLPAYRFVHGDITDRACLDRVFAEQAIDTVVHFAAESHVDRSISGPDAFRAFRRNPGGKSSCRFVGKKCGSYRI